MILPPFPLPRLASLQIDWARHWHCAWTTGLRLAALGFCVEAWRLAWPILAPWIAP